VPLLNHCKTLELILFQDAFKIVNALRAAKGKHKLLGIYFGMAHIHRLLRAKTASVQLILLCKDKVIMNYLKDLILPLLRDLPFLESGGVDIGFTENVLRMLGSHQVGGFSTNFNFHYVCRYCTQTQSDSLRCPAGPKPIRSVSHYDITQELADCRDQTIASVQEIKQPSVFAELRFLHVCNPGLPLCLAGDVFEGVLQNEMMLLIKYLYKLAGFHSIICTVE